MKSDDVASNQPHARGASHYDDASACGAGYSGGGDRHLLGDIAHHFVSKSFDEALGEALTATRDFLRADGAELFLSEPEGGDLIMVSCCGDHVDALVERVVFARGEGFPGRVAQTGRPVLSRHLRQDERFLRGEVKIRGLEAFASIPLRISEQIVGSLNLAWRQSPASFDRCVDVSGRVGSVIAGFAAAHFAQLREKIDRGIDPRQPADMCLQGALELIAEQMDSPMVVGRLFDSLDSSVFTFDGGFSKSDFPRVSQCPCRAMTDGHGGLLDERRDARNPCAELWEQMSRPCRVPLHCGRGPLGCLLLDLGTETDGAPTRRVIPSLVMAQQTARRLQDVVSQPGASSRANETASGGHGIRSVAAAPASDAELVIRCLGPLEIERGGEVVDPSSFSRKKAIEALELLALAPDSGVSRERLIEQLWPGTTGDSAANRLYVVIHALRNVLEPDGQRGKWRLVHSGDDRYWLDHRTLVDVDVHRFESVWKDVRRARRRGVPGEAVCGALFTMLDLYRGDLLADRRREWCLDKRTDLRRIFLEATRLCAGLLTEMGRPDEAISRLRRGLEVDEFDERLHQLLIRLLVRTGQHRLASRQFDECVTLLREELGCRPMPETRQLRDLLVPAVS